MNNYWENDLVSTSGGFNLGEWGSVQVIYQDPGSGVYYPGGYPGGSYPYPGGTYPGGYYPSQINWGTILIIALLALVVWKILK